MLGVLAWTIGWWCLEALPLGIGALTPALLMPFAGILSSDEVAASYMNDTNILIFSSLFLGRAISVHGLDRRVMLAVLCRTGGSIYATVGGMMLLVWFMSQRARFASNARVEPQTFPDSSRSSVLLFPKGNFAPPAQREVSLLVPGGGFAWLDIFVASF